MECAEIFASSEVLSELCKVYTNAISEGLGETTEHEFQCVYNAEADARMFAPNVFNVLTANNIESFFIL